MNELSSSGSSDHGRHEPRARAGVCRAGPGPGDDRDPGPGHRPRAGRLPFPTITSSSSCPQDVVTSAEQAVEPRRERHLRTSCSSRFSAFMTRCAACGHPAGRGRPEGLDLQQYRLTPGASIRIDQRLLPLNNKYIFNQTGLAVDVYVIDTGIRDTNLDFGGRAHAAACTPSRPSLMGMARPTALTRSPSWARAPGTARTWPASSAGATAWPKLVNLYFGARPRLHRHWHGGGIDRGRQLRDDDYSRSFPAFRPSPT